MLDESRGLFEREHWIESLTILLARMRTGNVKTVPGGKGGNRDPSKSAVRTSERKSKKPSCGTERDKGGAH